MNTIFAAFLGGWEIILILAVVLILFGAKKLPELAKGDANKVWIIPQEFTTALGNLGGIAGRLGKPRPADEPGSAQPPAPAS